ncbi:copper resistance CopC family protein [Geodermatophilus sp. SYSU D00696]
MLPVPRPLAALVRLLATAVLALGLVMAVPGTASAHTALRATEPAADSTVTSTPQAVTLTFSASVLGGEVAVTGPTGTPVGAGPVVHDGAVLTAPVTLVAAGRHTVTWSAVADDGHTLDGTFAFEYAPATPPPATAPTTSAPTSSAPTTDPTSTAASPTADGTPSSAETDTASAASDDGGLPGWVLPAAAVALLAAGAATVLRLRRRG